MDEVEGGEVEPCFLCRFEGEAEVAVVIGKRAKDVKAADAMRHVFGYVNFVDGSARGLPPPGNVFYQAQRSVEDPRLFYLYEQYVDEAGYEAHMESEHFTRLVKQEAIPELLEDRERAFYETIDDHAGGLGGAA